MKKIVLLFLAIALVTAGPGLLPGRTLAPLDLLLDFDAWKADPTARVRVSNSLLSDVIVQFTAWDTEVARLIGSGEMPWTNRWAGDGGPLFANPQTALLSPFTWPRLVFGLRGWAITALLKLLAAALFSYWFARELNIARRPAVVSALVFTLAGFTTVWLLWPHTNVFVLLPAFGAAGLRLMKEPRRRNAAVLIAVAALATAGGHPETLFVGVTGLLVFLVWESDCRRDLGLFSSIPVVVGALLGFLLLAVQLVPFFAILSGSHAGAIRPTLEHGFRVWGAAAQVLPGLLGSPLRGELDLTAVAGSESFNFRTAGYIGAIVLLAILLAWRDLSPTLRRGLVIGSVALLVSWYPPGVWTVLRHTPVLRVVALEYGVILFALFGSMCAGPALEALAARRRRKVPALLIAGGIALTLAGVLPALPAARPMLTTAARDGIESLRQRGLLRQPAAVYEQRLAAYLDSAAKTTLRRAALPGVLWLAAGLTLALPVRRRFALLSAIAVAELVGFGYGFSPAVPMTKLPAAPPAIAEIRRLDPAQRSLLAANFEVFPANTATLYGVRDAVSYDVLNSRERVEGLESAGYNPRSHSFNPILSPEQVRNLRSIGVRWVLSRGDVWGARRVAGPPPPAVGVYEVAGAIPQPMPPNTAPAGLLTGAIVSLFAALASFGWLRLFTLSPGAE